MCIYLYIYFVYVFWPPGASPDLFELTNLFSIVTKCAQCDYTNVTCTELTETFQKYQITFSDFTSCC